MKHLLVIDHDTSSATSLKSFLPRPYKISQTKNIQDSLRLIKKEPTHIILLDVQFLENHGLICLNDFLTYAPDIPIVMMSTTVFIRTLVTALQHGASDFITKPFMPEEVIGILQCALKQRFVRSKTNTHTIHQDHQMNNPKKQHPNLSDAMNAYEGQLILNALSAANGIQTKAAKLLGTTRRILRYRMKKLNISYPRSYDSNLDISRALYSNQG